MALELEVTSIPFGSHGPTILRKLAAGAVSFTLDRILRSGPEQGTSGAGVVIPEVSGTG